jgi:hypothetical protein
MRAVAEEGRKGNAYFGDDTLRTITLFARGIALSTHPQNH